MEQLQSLAELVTTAGGRQALGLLALIGLAAIIGGSLIRYCPTCGSPRCGGCSGDDSGSVD